MTTITAGTRPTAALAQETPQGPQEPAHDSWKTGLVAAGLGGIASFQRTLMPRPALQQAGITVASMAIGYGLGVGVDALAKGVEAGTGSDQTTSRLALAGVGGAGLFATTLAGAKVASRGGKNIPLWITRTAAGVIGGGGLAGAGLIQERRLADSAQKSDPRGAAKVHVGVLGAAAVAAGAIALGVRRPMAATVEEVAAYKAVLDGIPKTASVPPAFAADFAAQLATQRAGMTTISGKAASSLLPTAKLDAQGVRFLNEATPREEIARVMGGKPEELTSPFRVYGGLQHAKSHEELVANVVKEAGSLRNEAGKTALDSGTIVINIPSGTGYVAPPSVQALEYASRGDVTSIALQYHDKPSIQSVGKVPVAADLVREALKQLVPAIRSRPNGADTKIVLYSESLGSWASQNALRDGGVDTVKQHGLDYLINAGTPRFSKFRTDHLGFQGHTTDATGTITEFDNLTELPKLGTAARDKLSAFLVSHYDDPVTRWTPSQLVQPPPYLTSHATAIGIPPKMKWYPFVQGIQGLVDSANGASLPRGVLGARGHDYRGDIMPIVADIVGKPFTETQATAAMAAANQNELAFLASTKHPTT